MKKKMSKCLKINLIIWSIVLTIITSAALIFYFGARHPEFNTVATKSFSIPGLKESFVPQGMEYEESSNKFFVSGYMSNDEASRIYVIDKTSGATEKYVNLKAGEDILKGHFGGITVYGEDCFIASDKVVYRFKLDDMISASNGGAVAVVDSFEPGNGADFILTYQDMLIVGEYYHEKRFPTRTEHHIKTSSGETNHAVAYIYLLDSSATNGISLFTTGRIKVLPI